MLRTHEPLVHNPRLTLLFRMLTVFLCLTGLVNSAWAASSDTVSTEELYVPAGRTTKGSDKGLPTVISEYTIHIQHQHRVLPTHGLRDVVVFVHGFGDNVRLFKPLASELVRTGRATDAYLIDFPGHGQSTVSDHPDFGPRVVGTVDVNEYKKVLHEMLRYIRGRECPVGLCHGKLRLTLVGHSIGGLVIQLLQDQLSSVSSSRGLKGFNVVKTILISSDLPGGISWGGEGYARSLVLQLTQTHPQLGKHVVMSDEGYLRFKFTNFAGELVEGAPSGPAVSLLNDIEPYAAAANIVGLDPTGATTNVVPRMSVRPGIFSDENLAVVWLEQDGFFSRSEMEQLASHLKPGLSITPIASPNAVHNAPYSAPDLFVSLFE